MDKYRLIEYLQDILYLERTCYEEERILDNLKQQRYAYFNPELKAKEKYNYSYSDNQGFWIGEYLMWAFGISGLPIIILLCIYFVKSNSPSGVAKDRFGYLIAAICIAVLAIVIVIAKTRDELKKEQANNERIKKNNQKIQESNNSFKEQCFTIGNRISQEHDSIERQYKKTCDLLSDYYSTGIIYYKYRDFACIASILEYIESGRAKDLSDAYNLLEEEMRYNNIITKLDTIIAHLNQISMNQLYLYNAISQANRNINNMNNTILNSAKRINAQLERQNDNLESIRYVQEKDSRNLQLIRNLTFYNTFY
ncbi:hypothetical protein SAMN02910447_00467 [Ruminococcus sp. YE71]|uniref:hypothetical protein n=1 Tax=unclassified Ruminococcus TaxID=2608920 RepID=UPI0008860FFE|nr:MULTISPECIES: hypothetical protein [unclassified Ruminococcus]SDA11737.1 hypothetical protein SAMN02910446_00466 [Ruminococcus sp. YE78]SFW15680.1 hypothetical protein SAMN02910447_00467 [Ruminococcus sp. YE71]